MEPAAREYAPLAASEAPAEQQPQQQPALATLASEPMIVVAGHPVPTAAAATAASAVNRADTLAPAAQQWFYIDDSGVTQGPFTVAQMTSWAAGVRSPQTARVLRPGATMPMPLSQFPLLLDRSAATREANPLVAPAATAETRPLVAGGAAGADAADLSALSVSALRRRCEEEGVDEADWKGERFFAHRTSALAKEALIVAILARQSPTPHDMDRGGGGGGGGGLSAPGAAAAHDMDRGDGGGGGGAGGLSAPGGPPPPRRWTCCGCRNCTCCSYGRRQDTCDSWYCCYGCGDHGDMWCSDDACCICIYCCDTCLWCLPCSGDQAAAGAATCCGEDDGILCCCSRRQNGTCCQNCCGGENCNCQSCQSCHCSGCTCSADCTSCNCCNGCGASCGNACHECCHCLQMCCCCD